jgi:hypothetical protein
MKSVVLSFVAILGLMSEARAGITYKNASKKPIEIAVITTFNSNIYRDGWVRIEPGKSHRIGKGAFSPGDTYWIMAKVNGKNFEYWQPESTKFGTLTSTSAYMPPSGTKFGQLTENKEMATGMRQGDWSKFLREYGGTKFDAIKVTARTRDKLQNATLTFGDAFATFTP